MDEEKTESYRALYRVRPLIYHIGDIRLWMPIRQDGVVLWFVYIGVFFIFCYVFPVLAWLLPIDRAITMVVGPIAAAYYTVKLDPAGKTAPRYLRDILHFLVRPKWIVRWQRVRQSGGIHPIRFTGRCRPYERITLPSGGEAWRGSIGRLHGTVEGLQTLCLPANVRVRWSGRSGKLTVTPMKRPSKRAAIPPAVLEGKSRRTLVWMTAAPVRAEREKRDEHMEIWKVGKQSGIYSEGGRK
ncbi:TcpE family conjugal transfer membrane protein [Ferviditalea candida]|uniref:TcpE family conjugal transfer membrane protein n=1 Tax=Ferviditalea candida TaxID=3108399 RepID=A0ABU5ZKY8_9BACL|nr:TcpE family conjugal transfer membrane protein [Paenibacillaceae bacterium T2]